MGWVVGTVVVGTVAPVDWSAFATSWSCVPLMPPPAYNTPAKVSVACAAVSRATPGLGGGGGVEGSGQRRVTR